MNNVQPNVQSVRGIANILDALQIKGIISNDQYKAIKFESINTQKSIEDLIKEKNIVSPQDIARMYAEMRNIGYIDLPNISIPVETLNLIPSEVANQNRAIVFEDVGKKVKVAMKDPLDLQKVKFLESLINKSIEPYYSSDEDIQRIIETRYGAQIGSEVDEALQEVNGNQVKLEGNGHEMLSQQESLETAPIIKIVNMILEYGVNNKASDIHIEPRETKISVRFRVRGVLTEKLTIPRKLLSAVVTRIKILSNLKIDEHRIPQDGRFQVSNENARVDIRVSIMPSIYGEKIVMRLLEKTRGIMNLEDTGMRGISFSRMRDSLSRTQGIILVTGPTGSGKSQTLASCLKILNSSEVNIITLEDPVEIRIDGINQVQVNAEVGLTFGSGLRAILRQDPDVIMVGEIRDAETATLAVQAALVGRLVLSTLHTNSAAGAFVRLIDMGIEPFLLSSTVNLVLAQRLVRTLCDSKRAYKASAEELAQLHEALDPLNGIDIVRADGTRIHFDKNTNDVTLYEPVSTVNCESGYNGRSGIFEALKVSENIAHLVSQKKSIKDIQDQAVAEGMLTMVQDGFIKVIEGITTIDEVLRVKNE